MSAQNDSGRYPELRKLLEDAVDAMNANKTEGGIEDITDSFFEECKSKCFEVLAITVYLAS